MTKTHLDKLTISRRAIVSARARRKTDKVEYRRKKLIAHLEEQIELAQLALDGHSPALVRKRRHGEVKVHPRLWWSVDDDGHVGTVVRYKNINLNLDGRGATIEVGPLRRLPGVDRIVIRAVEADELDRTIEGGEGPRLSRRPATADP
jgi:hypothetical protein